MTIQSSNVPFDRGVFIELTSNVASIFVLNVLNVSCTQEEENNVLINCTYWVELKIDFSTFKFSHKCTWFK